ncbi:MAG TPA: hypothetical protein ACN46L_02520, partial [Prochlorococcus sp.]
THSHNFQEFDLCNLSSEHDHSLYKRSHFDMSFKLRMDPANDHKNKLTAYFLLHHTLVMV